MTNSKDRPPKRLLVISITGIGDTLMGTPALRALRKSFPQSEIHLLVNSKRKELVQGNPNIDRVLEYRNNFLSRGLLFFKTLSFHYDFVLVFHANEDIWKILKVVHYDVCYNRQNYQDPARRVLPLDSLPQHSIQKRLALVEKVGGKDLKDYRYDYFLPWSQIRWAEEKIKEWGISSKDRLIGIQLGAADAFKRWPLESFVEAAQCLQAKHKAKIYLNASIEEKDLVRQFERLVNDKGVFHHFTENLSRSAALIKRCSLFISNDTGPMHMAMGLGVPLIALFCPSDPEATGPIGHQNAVIIRKEKPCNPCLFRKCQTAFCMEQISVEEVYQAADQILLQESSG